MPLGEAQVNEFNVMIPKILVSLLWVGTLIVAQDCPLPSWTVKDVKTKLKDAVGNGGSASLTIIPTGTDKAETLTCASLQGNYRCHIVSKAQPGLEIDIQINTQVAHVSVTQMKFACGSAT
ncbi:hypothetical protein QBC47DRAFT_407527 [Echria macrotheca]|uniref:Uncharacterized protein n=1 Tax=Echria macrotheca TaxID=438768 RepID=A0AAJ0B1B2_9PEZI|nr:hypothetical protein QBC47DRAFT_407527 [Echria macrotheca]